MKIMSLETRASSAEQENDSLKLALKLIMQEMNVGERQQQRNQSYEVTAPQGNSKSDNAQSNESSNPENEWQTVDAKKKKNKTRRKKISEAQSNAHDDTENSTPANESTSRRCRVRVLLSFVTFSHFFSSFLFFSRLLCCCFL